MEVAVAKQTCSHGFGGKIVFFFLFFFSRENSIRLLDWGIQIFLDCSRKVDTKIVII